MVLLGEAEREQARVDHLEWLRLQREAFAIHQAREHPVMERDAPPMMDVVTFSAELEPACESEVCSGNYPALAAQHGQFDDEGFDGVVYRSLSSFSTGSHDHDPSDGEQHIELAERDSDALWLAGAHPPLLRRQTAFGSPDA